MKYSRFSMLNSRLPVHLRYELMVQLDKTVIDRIQVISWLGFILYIFLLFIDLYRYKSGTFPESSHYRWLFYFHLGGILYLVPAFLTTFAKSWSKKTRLSRGLIIWFTFAAMTGLLFGQALVAYATYGRVTLFVTYVLVTNWTLAMNQKQRILFNSACVVIMLTFMLQANDGNVETLIISLYEVFFFTVIAFIFDLFDSRLQEANFLHEKMISQEKSRVELEKSRVDKLLLSVLPAEIAQELLEKGKIEAREFDNVTVLFTDFVGFTRTSERMLPQDLLGELNYIFQEFDQITFRHGIQKIKSMGDAYMAAGSLGVPSPDAALDTIYAAIEMQEFIEQHCKLREFKGKPAFHMRVGIHTGPVIAGIVGQNNFQYDIWGDTVNIASRLEQNGTQGKINISEAVRHTIGYHETLNFIPRGAIQVKGKGDIEMWYVEKFDQLQIPPDSSLPSLKSEEINPLYP